MSNSTHITSVWSSYGHTFITEGEYESCLTCGAMYALVATPAESDLPWEGDYQAANGDAPQHCTGDTSMGHGEDFMSADSTCNCLLCS